MKKHLSIILFLTLALPFNAYATSNILVVFDASGSMLEKLGTITRIDAAKTALQELLETLSSDVKVGLRPYADVKKSVQAEACVQTRLAVPFTTDRGLVRTAATSVQAVGSYTPTAYALKQSKNDFKVGEDNTLVLLTDGKETCGGDPAAVAKELLDAGIKVTTHVVGIGVDAAARAELSAVATAGGGRYFDATNANTLGESLTAIADSEEAIDKTNTDAQLGTSIRGGNGYETALELTPGTYHLDHNLKTATYDYFKISAEKGVSIKITVITGDSGVYYDKATDTFKPLELNHKPYAGAMLMSVNRGKLKDALATERSTERSFEYIPAVSGQLYLLVGVRPSISTGAMAQNALFVYEKEGASTLKEDQSTTGVTKTTEPGVSGVTVSSESSGGALQDENSFGAGANDALPTPPTDFAQTQKTESKTSSAPWMIAVALGVLVLVLVAVIAKLLMRRKTPQQVVPPVISSVPSAPPITPPTPPSVPPAPPQQ